MTLTLTQLLQPSNARDEHWARLRQANLCNLWPELKAYLLAPSSRAHAPVVECAICLDSELTIFGLRRHLVGPAGRRHHVVEANGWKPGRVAAQLGIPEGLVLPAGRERRALGMLPRPRLVRQGAEWVEPVVPWATEVAWPDAEGEGPDGCEALMGWVHVSHGVFFLSFFHFFPNFFPNFFTCFFPADRPVVFPI